jgi:hypothetical protein
MAERLGAMQKVLSLCRHGFWLCPNKKELCGAVNGVTQHQLRDDIFLEVVKRAIANQFAEKNPERMN